MACWPRFPNCVDSACVFCVSSRIAPPLAFQGPRERGARRITSGERSTSAKSCKCVALHVKAYVVVPPHDIKALTMGNAPSGSPHHHTNSNGLQYGLSAEEIARRIHPKAKRTGGSWRVPSCAGRFIGGQRALAGARRGRPCASIARPRRCARRSSVPRSDCAAGALLFPALVKRTRR